jgi:glycosyltransferase involved in cell wall biosynthesis
MAEMPLITVGLTCFQAADTICQAIQSAVAQDWPNLEIIIVDDCSTDGSAKIVEQAIAGVANANLIRHAANGGPAVARNSLLAAAKGEFLIFFDDDDKSHSDRVRVQYDRLQTYERDQGGNLVACYASGLRRYDNGYELQMDAIGSRSNIPKGSEVANYLLFNGRKEGVFYGAGTPTCALMARTSTFRALGGFDSALRRVEDMDFAVRLALMGGHFIGCPERLFVQHATIAPDKTPGKNLDAELQIIEKHASYLRQNKRYTYARDWFRIRFYHFSRQHFKFTLSVIWFLARFPLSGLRHLLRTAPNRIYHERNMLGSTRHSS